MGLPRRTSSFDDIQDDDHTAVVDTVDDELRKMVALMPGRNEERMFSDGSKKLATTPQKTPPAPAAPHLLVPRNAASAPTTATGEEYDSASYYYTYSDGTRTTTHGRHRSSRHTEPASTEAATTETATSKPRNLPRPAAAAQARNKVVASAAAAAAAAAGARAGGHHRHPPQYRSAHPSSVEMPSVPNFSIGGGSQGFGFTMAGWGDTVSRHNMSDAFATVWDRFWSEDLAKIAAILRHRLNQLLPHARRFIAHVVAFWKGITYLRRAFTAFIRILNKDSRVRELLERMAWASASTLRIFLSICAMTLHAMLRFYAFMRDRVIPELRLILPRYYSRAAHALHDIAARSPWSSSLGPLSMEVALHRSKLPDPEWLHRKFGVHPRDHAPSRARETAPVRAREAPPTSSGAPEDSGSYLYTYGTGTTKYVDENGATLQSRPRNARTVHDDDDEDASSGSYEYTYGTGTRADESRRHGPETTEAGTSEYATLTERNGDSQSIYPGASKDMLATKYAERQGKQPIGKENMIRASPVSRQLGYDTDDDLDDFSE